MKIFNKFILTLALLPILGLCNPNTMVVGKKLINDNNNITMDLNILGSVTHYKKKQPIVIELTTDKRFVFIPKRLRSGKKEGDFTWVGKSKDGKSKAVISVRNGVMMGTITSADGEYKLYPENGHFKVIKIDPDMVIPFHIDTVIEDEKKKILLPEPKASSRAIDISAKNSSVIPSIASPTDSNVTVLVYYTQALEDQYGVNTEAMIQANLDLAKNAYADSNTEINVQIVALKKVPVGSLLSSAVSSDLNDLLTKLRTDGLVRYERQVYHADAVTVFSKYPGSGSCGLGSTPTSTTSSLVNAFSAVHIKPASEGGYYCPDLSFAHELGHNFGCFHDADHVSSGSAMYAYAYGYDIINEFGTIMSYDGPGIGYFSNPDLNYTNTNTGNTNAIGDVGSADNAHAIRANQYKLADNSEQISEVLESNDSDTLSDYNISGRLSSNVDKDGYIVWLEGSTQFTLDNNVYSNNPFFVNLYNETTHTLLYSFNDAQKTLVLNRDRYRIVVSFFNDETSTYYGLATLDYTVNMTTEYIPASFLPAVISYLLN